MPGSKSVKNLTVRQAEGCRQETRATYVFSIRLTIHFFKCGASSSRNNISDSAGKVKFASLTNVSQEGVEGNMKNKINCGC